MGIARVGVLPWVLQRVVAQTFIKSGSSATQITDFSTDIGRRLFHTRIKISGFCRKQHH